MQPRLYSVLKDASARVQPISVHVAFLLIGVRGVRPFSAVLVSALFRLPCSISINLSPRSVTAVVHPFPLAMPCSSCIHVSPRSVTGVRPFPLAM